MEKAANPPIRQAETMFGIYALKIPTKELVPLICTVPQLYFRCAVVKFWMQDLQAI